MENMVERLIAFCQKKNGRTKLPDEHGKVEEEMELCFRHQNTWHTFSTDGEEVVNNM